MPKTISGFSDNFRSPRCLQYLFVIIIVYKAIVDKFYMMMLYVIKKKVYFLKTTKNQVLSCTFEEEKKYNFWKLAGIMCKLARPEYQYKEICIVNFLKLDLEDK